MDNLQLKNVIILLVLSTLISSKECPMECDCPDNGKAVHATCEFYRKHSERKYGQFIPTHTISLSLLCTDGSHHKLQPKMFSGLSKLEVLSFHNCSFESIDQNTFIGLNKLQSLAIQGATRLPIRSDTFRQIPNLLHLRIIFSGRQWLLPNSLCMLKKIRYFNFEGNGISSMSQVLQLCSQNESFFNGIEMLSLKKNQIQILKTDFRQKLKHLNRLSLKGNKIGEIQQGALSNFSQLMYLDISENNLKQLPDDFLSGSVRIKILSVSSNPITKLPPSFKEFKNLEVFSADNTSLNDINSLELKPLIILSIRFSSLTTIPTSLCRTNSTLVHLNLEQNRISNIDERIFRNCQKLEFLVLSSNNISTLFKESFKGLKHLQLLDLSNNNISSSYEWTFLNLTTLKVLYLSSNSLVNVPLVPLNVSELRIDHNKITNIPKNLYKLKNLTELFAGHNLLFTTHQNTFPESVTTIYLQNNQIETVGNLTFANLPNLRKVDLRNNRIVTLSLQSVKVSSNLKGRKTPKFYISGNLLRCDCELVWLKFGEKKLFTFCNFPLFKDLSKVKCIKYGKPWLPDGMFQELEMKDFLCEYKNNPQNLSSHNGTHRVICPEICFCTHTYNYRSIYVDCRKRNLTDKIAIPRNTKWIDLSGNNLGGLSSETLMKQTKVEYLYLNNSKITRIGRGSFTAFKSLRVLHLEYNEIRMLYTDSLVGLSKLKKLILSHNKIELILPGTFKATHSLEILDLSNNKLKQIDSQTLILNSLKTIALSGNPWSCKCTNIKSMRELSDTRSIDFKTVFCDQSNMQVLEYEKDNCWNPKSYTKYFIGLIIGFGFILALCITGTCMYMYIHKTEIKILLFVRFGWRFKKIRQDEEDKKYDAFVSYHNTLDDFVVDEMLPRLEGMNPAYKLCVHLRDFTAGAAIVDNITESIENSKRTILLLNNQFLASEWCKYEFQTAHLEALSNKLNTLIVVLLEDVNPKLVYGGLKLYLKTKTYLRYDDPRFWNKLRFALPVIKEDNPVNQDDFL